MFNEMTDMCNELDTLQRAQKIPWASMWDFCNKYNPAGRLALMLEGPNAIRTQYEAARNEFRAIKRRARLNPDVGPREMQSAKQPSRVLLTIRVYRPLMGYSDPGSLSITDVNYKFVPDAQPGRRVLPDENGFWDLSGATLTRINAAGLIASYVDGCAVVYKQGGTRLDLSAFWTEDSQVTANLCNALNQAIQAYNRLHPNVY
jgi:hypothetical protein